MTDETAEKLAHHLQLANAELGRAVQIAKDECSADEFDVWQQRLAAVMGTLFINALGPLYEERPSLAPDALQDHFRLRPSK